MANSPGRLFLIATPLGNLDDMTYRAVQTIQDCDYVFCEDTRRSLILLKHFRIEPKNHLESFHDHSSRGQLARVIGFLKQGLNVGYMTDGGMPVVSDPGFVLVRAAIENDIEVSVIPGATAATTLFAASALPSPKFFFHGFFPRTKGEVEKVLQMITEMPVVHLFYEAPVRILGALEILQRHYPKARVVLGRELTKLHEEVIRGTAKEVHEVISAREKLRGECVLAVLLEHERFSFVQAQLSDNPQGTAPAAPAEIVFSSEMKEEIAALLKSGVSSKDAAKMVSKKWRIPRRAVYEFIIRHLT